MTETFIKSITQWMEVNPVIAIAMCFVWGIVSVLLSPCHMAVLSIFAMPQVRDAPVRHKVFKFMGGHVLALFAIGLILIFFNYQLAVLGHYWTVPFGFLFLLMGWQLGHCQHCAHCADEVVHRHGENQGYLGRFIHSVTQNSRNFVFLGFVYGALSGACVLIFLAPILLLGQHENFALLVGANAAFAIGHTLPICLVGVLAKSLHMLMHRTENFLRVPRYIAAALVFCIGLVLIAHPFLELWGFDFHGHGHEHGHGHGHEHK